MLMKAVLLFIAYLFITCFGRRRNESDITTKYPYPELYRHHVYHSLSEKGMELFSAIKIHPDCSQRHGECIRRAACIEKKMLYISRVCYTRDLVCCYDDVIRHIVVEPRGILKTTSTPSTTTKHLKKLGRK